MDDDEGSDYWNEMKLEYEQNKVRQIEFACELMDSDQPAIANLGQGIYDNACQIWV